MPTVCLAPWGLTGRDVGTVRAQAASYCSVSRAQLWHRGRGSCPGSRGGDRVVQWFSQYLWSSHCVRQESENREAERGVGRVGRTWLAVMGNVPGLWACWEESSTT